MNEVIGECALSLEKMKPEGTLNNWVTDVMKTEAERASGKPVDFALSNYGGIRINTLPAGPVTKGRSFDGTGGNAGSQTVATIIRALTLGEVRLANIGQAWLREVSAGMLLGVAMAGVGFARAMLWHTGVDVALVVTLTLPLVVIWATTIATLVPIIANHFDIDPTVISGPMISTIVDTTGLLIYFLLAKLLLGI
jgi:magnesium transporter